LPARRLAIGVALAVLGAACGSDAAPAVRGAGDRVSGYLVVHDDGRARLCSALGESFPPQCAGDVTEVEGLDADEVNDLESGADVRWSDTEITLLGTLGDSTLVVPYAATGPAITGRAVAGPTCPVETTPPDPSCAGRSVAGARVVILDAGGDAVATLTTDATGRFAAHAEAGRYTVEAQPVDGLLGTAPPLDVTVGTDPVDVDLAYDTGIR
jgi:hypothetical protein